MCPKTFETWGRSCRMWKMLLNCPSLFILYFEEYSSCLIVLPRFQSGAHFVIETTNDLPEVIKEINRRMAMGIKPWNTILHNKCSLLFCCSQSLALLCFVICTPVSLILDISVICEGRRIESFCELNKSLAAVPGAWVRLYLHMWFRY